MNIKAKMKKVRGAANRVETKVLGRVAVVSHLSYYALVGIEAHGNYRYAAMVVGVIVVLEALRGDNGGVE